MVTSQILRRFEDLQSRLVDVSENPHRHEFWNDRQWQTWKYLIRATGKQICVAAAADVLGDIGTFYRSPSLVGTGVLPPDRHSAIISRLLTGINEWLAADNPTTRAGLRDALSELENAIATERAKYSFSLVSSESQPVEVLGSLAEVTIAAKSFEKHIRMTFVRAHSLDTNTAARFRERLARRIATVGEQ